MLHLEGRESAVRDCASYVMGASVWKNERTHTEEHSDAIMQCNAMQSREDYSRYTWQLGKAGSTSISKKTKKKEKKKKKWYY